MTKDFSIVSVVRVSGELENSIEKTLELAEFDLAPKSKVVIKINLSSLRTYDTGCTTDPRVLRSLVNILRNKYSADEIVVVESDSSLQKVDLLYNYLGFESLGHKLGFQFVNLSNDRKVTKKINGCHFMELAIPATISEADCFISLAKLKMHSDVGISCGLKNQFGCYPFPRKIRYHEFLNDAIVDANIAMKPHFTIVDGLIAMVGPGSPTFGLPIKAKILVGSQDVVAADSVCARIFGLNPNGVKMIRKSHQKGIGNMKSLISMDGFNRLPRLYFEQEDAWDKILSLPLRTYPLLKPYIQKLTRFLHLE